MPIFFKIPGGDAGKSVKEAFDTAENIVQTEILNNVVATNTVLIQRQSNARAAVQQAEVEADILRRKNKKSRKELEDAESSLVEWKTAYEQLEQSYQQQREVLKDWMMSQQRFKELALKYGVELLGKSRDQVIEDFKVAKERVRNNTTAHGNNSKDLNY